MGREVARLPGGARVAGGTGPSAESFGRWFARERRLRDIPLAFVAARTKLPAVRLEALEAERLELGHDGHARAAARALARAIGADPDQALARLLGDPERQADLATGSGRRTGSRAGRMPWAGLAAGAALAGLLAVGALQLAAWLDAPPEEPAPDVVYQPNHLKRLLRSGR